MKNEGSFGHNTVLVGDGGVNRVKKSFYDKRRSGLIICQHIKCLTSGRSKPWPD